jgi:heme-degrading monooxygenase HmoA
MIARVWRGIATQDNVAHYVEHFQRGVLPELKQLNGFHEAHVLQKATGNQVEITVMTWWDSMDAIRSFAGDNVETAVVAPAAHAVLIAYDTTVTHYEMLLRAD